jgi:hypothetical protein
MIFASAIAGLFFFTRGTGSDAASDRHLTGTIQLAPQGSTCQRLVIDNSTGTIKPGQPMPCGDVAKEAAPRLPAPKEAARVIVETPSRYSSGGRVDAIRDSFKNR